MTLHVASLFSGIGLIDLGFHRAAIPTRLLCEADPAARSVLARRFSGTPIHDDVRELTADDLRAAGCDPDRTVLAAGFPCQDLSVAGSRRGMGRGVEGFQCIAIEKTDEYLPLIMQRIHRRRDPVAAIRQTGDELGLFELDGEGA